MASLRIPVFTFSHMQYITESLRTPPLVSSAALPWRGIRVEQIELGAGGLPAQARLHHLLILYQVPVPYAVHHVRNRQTSRWVYQTGDLGLYPGGDCSTDLSWSTPSHNIYLTIEADYMTQLVSQGPELQNFALQEQLKFQDPLLNVLGRQLLTAASQRHALGSLYAESLTNALCHQLIEHHATYQRRYRQAPHLSAPVLARIDEYLEAHTEHAVTLAELAGLANLSVFHFARLFRQTVGLTPYQYVLHWKIQRARHLLCQDGVSVADVSDALGFASPASFGAAFRRIVGCTPQQYGRHFV